jgi:hypothetical protein
MKKFIAASLITIAATLGISGSAQAGTPEQNNAAMQEFSSTVGVATTTGGLVGTGVGFITGCILGGLVTSPTVVFVPIGCLTGGATFAAAGGVIGTLVVGGPTAVIKGVQMVQVLLTPAS